MQTTLPKGATRLARIALSLTLLPATLLAADTVYIVDSSGGGNFVEIADALPVVGQGDVLLVRPGNYSSDVVLVNQSITIIADGTGPVILEGGLEIQSLDAQGNVTILGLQLDRGFTVENCIGPVRFQDCPVPKTNDLAAPLASLGYFEYQNCGVGSSLQKVTNSQAVTLVDCEFVGRSGALVPGVPGFFDGAPGEHGLLVTNSTVLLYHCWLEGGDGSDSISGVHNGHVPGAGGDGLHLRGNSLARITQGVRVGGAGGEDTYDGIANGPPACGGVGARAENPVGLVWTTHAKLRFDMPSLMVGAVPGPLTVEGPPGALAFHLQSMGDRRRLLPPSVGALHLTSPLQVTTLGTIPNSGLLTSSFVDAGPGTPFGVRNLHSQVYVRLNGALFLSQPLRTVVVDPGL